MAKFTLRYELIYRFSKLRKLEADALRVLHGFADDVIRKRREELMEIANRTENDQDNGGDNIGARKKRALLDILLHSTIDDKPLSDLDIREEVIIITQWPISLYLYLKSTTLLSFCLSLL